MRNKNGKLRRKFEQDTKKLNEAIKASEVEIIRLSNLLISVYGEYTEAKKFINSHVFK
jgi:hypothetical protein